MTAHHRVRQRDRDRRHLCPRQTPGGLWVVVRIPFVGPSGWYDSRVLDSIVGREQPSA